MVSFQCDGCADTVKKPQLDKHRQRCWAPFTCLDCSTTFHNQDYKTHTSCISEAEKYQGSLYRGPRKGQQTPSGKATPATSAAASGAATPADSPAPSEGAGMGIHPSRLNQMQAGEARGGAGGGFARGGGLAARGGRGGFGNRGGFGAPQKFGGPTRKSVTGENRTAPESGMRTWGSAPVSEVGTPAEQSPAPAAAPQASAPASVSASVDGEGKKKKKRKGDKGGTGSKANSRINNETAEAASEEPPAKKRKRDEEKSADVDASQPPSDKTLKRIRKHMSKLEDKVEKGIPLAEWLKKVSQGKDKEVDQGDVLRGVQVVFKEGRWQLAVE